jgi:UDP-glucose 4-epimerase
VTMKRVVILGHTGFIGAALHVLLERVGHLEVVGFSSQTADLRRTEGVQALEGQIDQETVVIFASAITRDKGDTIGTFMDNVGMAAHVGAFLETHPPAKCVFLSSDAVYPMQLQPVTEDTPVSPGGTFYGIGKYAAECVLRRSAEVKGFPLLILRPTAVFGPGDTHNSYGPNAFIRSIIREHSVRIFGHGEERRDHLYIGDLVRLVASLITVEAVGTVNVATGVSRSFAEVVEALRHIVPFEFSVSNLPRRGPITHREFDISRLRRHVGGVSFAVFEEALAVMFGQAYAVPGGN